jgi:predicted nucleotidyltransferase
MPNDYQARFGLKKQVIERINNVFAHVPEIDRVILYGSRAKGDFRTGSDIDLTIEGGVSDSQLLRIETELEDLDLPYMIDLSLFHRITNPDLVDHIHRVGVIFYERPRQARSA